MIGKGIELSDVMEGRKLDILRVQETKWKFNKARNISIDFKIFYHGLNERRNGVRITLKVQLIKYVLEVQRMSNRMIKIKVEVEGERMNLVSAYAAQVRSNLEENELLE